ncbi:MAG TPA: glycosyltransferase [Armatimonadota bacterium]|nr:glycosyltransferase [Armatimonadota bacterium]
MTDARPLRVLHVITQSRPLGGAQHNTLALAARMDRARFDSAIACGPGGPLIAAARAAGVAVTVVPTLDNPVRPLADLRALAALIRLCGRGGFDIVHTHSTKGGILGRLAAARCRVPVVVHTVHAVPFHDAQRPLIRWASRWAERLAAGWCDRLIAIGDTVGEDFVRAGVCARRDIVTIRSGIDFSRFDAPVDGAAARQRLGLAPGQPVVGAVGHLLEAKGYPYLLEAARMLRTRFPDLRVLIVGEGPLERELRVRSRALGVADCCLFLGRRDDVPELLRAMDVFAQASLWEGVPRAVQEAMYVGLPVVATAIAGTAEIVGHDATGLLVPARDAAALARALAELLTDPERAARLGAQGRRRISGEFSVARTVQRTAALYLELWERWGRREREAVLSSLRHTRPADI